MIPVNPALRRDIARAISNRKAEHTDAGLVIPSMGLVTFGHFVAHPFEPDGAALPKVLGANRVVREGLVRTLNLIGNHVQGAAYYLAPFSADVAPADDWKGSTFAATAEEFKDYTSETRVPWTTAVTTTPSISNSAALNASTLVFNAGGPYTIRGIALLTSSGKGSTTGTLFAATRFDDDLMGMRGGGRLGLEYILVAADESDV